MKKFTVLVALALLAATGTSYAVTCAYDNVPAATLLVPYFKVARNGATSGAIPEGGVDTLVALTNVSEWGIIAHVTVWNKQSAPVLDFNVPMTGYDVTFFRMKDVLNGNLNVNPNTQVLVDGVDPCKDYWNIGNSQTQYMRFTHPNWGSAPSDWFDSIAFYATPAFSGSFRNRIWDSLDESADYTALISRPARDVDNPACGSTNNTSTTDNAFADDFTGYLTIDVVNFCTNFFPDQADFYVLDAIATRGWIGNGGPNVLMGDVFFVDGAAANGNISGDPAVALEFDLRLEGPSTGWDASAAKTFYARYSQFGRSAAGVGAVPDNATGQTWSAYAFIGDGREPLGTQYGFRYLSDTAAGLQSFATVWRADRWDDNATVSTGTVQSANLCRGTSTNSRGSAAQLNTRPISIYTWDNDENENQLSGGGPSGDQAPILDTFVWWETNRVILAGNSDMNPANFKGGWTWWVFNNQNTDRYNQAWVGIQHTAPGALVSVGHSATLMNQNYTCDRTVTAFTATNGTGNVDY